MSRETVSAVDGTGSTGLEGDLSLLATFGAHRIEHLASGATKATTSAESSAVSTKSTGTLAASATGTVAETATATFAAGIAAILTTVGAAPWLVRKTLGRMEFLLSGGKGERRFTITTG